MADKESKKRKRQSNAIPAPNKRTAVESVTSARVPVQFSSGSGIEPVLLSMPGLTAPQVAFQAYSKSSSTAHGDGTSHAPRDRDLLLHSSEHPRIDYTATATSLDQHLSHYIALYDPTAKKIQIVPSSHLELRSTLRTAPKDEAEKNKRTIGQQRAELGRSFGTKKAKKVIADRTVNAIVNGEPGKGKSKAQDAILDSMAESALPTLNAPEQIEAELASKPIPKPNLQAEEAKDVYNFDTLIPADHAALITMKEWREAATKGQEINFSHRYPARRVRRLGKSDEILRLKALRYITLLLQFNDALQPAGKEGKKVPPKDRLSKTLAEWPQQLVDKVRVRFSDRSNSLPKWNIENLYTHICALSLYIDHWTTDTSQLRDDLKMENTDIMRYFRELGCKVAAPTETELKSVNEWFGGVPMTKELGRSVRIAKLKLPLEFPKAGRGRRA